MKSRRQADQQLSFVPRESSNTRFGGGLRKGKRKLARPVSVKKSMHVTLRASCATGKWSMLMGENPKKIEAILRKFGKRYGVLIERDVNVGNHLHLLVRASSRRGFQAFLRAVAGNIAMVVTGAKKGLPRAFWDALAFSRFVEWGKDRTGVLRYFAKNILESLRMIRKGKVVGYTTDLWPEFALWMGLPP